MSVKLIFRHTYMNSLDWILPATLVGILFATTIKSYADLQQIMGINLTELNAFWQATVVLMPYFICTLILKRIIKKHTIKIHERQQHEHDYLNHIESKIPELNIIHRFDEIRILFKIQRIIVLIPFTIYNIFIKSRDNTVTIIVLLLCLISINFAFSILFILMIIYIPTIFILLLTITIIPLFFIGNIAGFGATSLLTNTLLDIKTGFSTNPNSKHIELKQIQYRNLHHSIYINKKVPSQIVKWITDIEIN